jgi:hypothetical protein
MSAIERMIAFHLERLKDKNPEVRLKSIEELIALEAAQALGVLEEIYRNDPAEEVRKAAQRAGRAIFLKVKEKEKGDGA